MKKDNLTKYLNRLKTNPPSGGGHVATAKFTVEDTVEEGEGWIRIRCPEGRLAIWIQNNVAHQIMDPAADLKWSCTKENIEYAIELCGGLWWE